MKIADYGKNCDCCNKANQELQMLTDLEVTWLMVRVCVSCPEGQVQCLYRKLSDRQTDAFFFG